MNNKRHLLLVAALALASLPFALPAGAQAPTTQAPAAQAPAAQAGLRVGALRCEVAGATSFVFGSTRNLTCTFSPTSGAAERYTGEIRRFGIDIGQVSSGVILWGVLAPTNTVGAGALAGTYVGVSASATAGVGVGANVLVGGGNSVSLQPLSVEGTTGANIAVGVAEITLARAP